MNKNFAVLIDGDNIPSAHVTEMLEEIAKYGNPTIKRIYGDWTRPGLNSWKNLLLEMQYLQFSNMDTPEEKMLRILL